MIVAFIKWSMSRHVYVLPMGQLWRDPMQIFKHTFGSIEEIALSGDTDEFGTSIVCNALSVISINLTNCHLFKNSIKRKLVELIRVNQFSVQWFALSTGKYIV